MAIPYDPGKRLKKAAAKRKRQEARKAAGLPPTGGRLHYKRMPCDGTERDYWRHAKRGEEPCAASRRGHALAQRRRRKTGVRVNDVPANDLTDLLYRSEPK